MLVERFVFDGIWGLGAGAAGVGVAGTTDWAQWGIQ